MENKFNNIPEEMIGNGRQPENLKLEDNSIKTYSSSESIEEENTFYYESLQKMVEAGTLDIKLILSPPRTGSTLMETSFSKNDSIDAQIHEPFIVLRKGKAEVGYKKIYDVGSSLDVDHSEKRKVVVKEMSHWLMTNNEHEKLLPLVKDSPIVLVRNPLLNTESRIKKIIETLDMREKPALQEILLDYYARSKGEDSWKSFIEKYIHLQDNNIDDEAVRLCRLVEHKKDFLDQGESEIFPLQRWLLDYYAITKGYKRWKAMLAEGFDNRRYKEFEEILGDGRIYDIEGSGWKATAKLIKYLEDNDKPPIIVDSSDYRLLPDKIVPGLCKRWNIPFSEDMINWGG